MSPAMAHRSNQQNAVIAHMAEGLVSLAILPHMQSKVGIYCYMYVYVYIYIYMYICMYMNMCMF
jgi:hypothetical protein